MGRRQRSQNDHLPLLCRSDGRSLEGMKAFLTLPQVAVLLTKQKIFRSLGLSHPSLPQFLRDDSSSTTVPIPFRPTKISMIVILACPYHDDHLEQAMPFCHLFLVFPFLQNLKCLMRERPFRLLSQSLIAEPSLLSPLLSQPKWERLDWK